MRALGTMALLLVACVAPTPAQTCAPPQAVFPLRDFPVPRLADLLVVIDDSSSIAASRPELARQVGDALGGLASGDVDLDGVIDYAPPSSIRVAVVTGDLGAGSAAGRFRCTAEGDAAALHDFGGTTSVELIGAPPSAIDALVLAMSPAASGCGIEQPIAAAARAISRADFFRPDSHAALLFVTDEDDCSSDAPALEADGDPSTDPFCAERPLSSLDALAETLADLGEPGFESVIVLAGVPARRWDGDWTALLDDPAMTRRLDDSRPATLLASCTSASGATATPPRRLVSLLQSLDALYVHASVLSICDPFASDLFWPVVNTFDEALGGGGCLHPEMHLPDGRVDCDLVITIPPGHSCDASGASLVRHVSDGDVCLVPQVTLGEVSSVDAGWAFDDGDLAAGTCPHLAGPPTRTYPFGTRGIFRCWDGAELAPHCE
jgi:hypothetical protein